MAERDLRLELLVAATDRVATGGLDALRDLLRPSLLARKAGLAKDSAYRLFPHETGQPAPDPLIAATSARIVDSSTWNGIDNTLAEVAAAYDGVGAGSTALDALRAAMEANIDASFDSPGWPAGFLMQAAAMTASPRWAGSHPADPHSIALGQRILEDRRRHYDDLNSLYEPMLRRAMSDVGLRPKGLTTIELVRLLHCFLDGAVLMMFFEPELASSQVAAAMVALGIALGEPGSFQDPRRPTDSVRAAIFDRAVAGVTLSWEAAPTSAQIDFSAAAQTAGLDPGVLMVLFPSQADAADSLLRAQLVDLGFVPLSIGAELTLTPALIVGALRKFAATAERFPGAITCLQSNLVVQGTSLLDDAISDLREALTDLNVHVEQARADSVRLISAASGGIARLSNESEVLDRIRALIPISTRI